MSAAAMAAATLLLAGCGGQTRSTAALCNTLHFETQRILAQFNASSHPGSNDQLVQALSGLGASLQALRELRTYFHKLSDVGPDEIKEDQEVSNAANEAANPLSAFAGALASGAMDSGQLSTLNQFALTHCHESV